MKKEILKLLKKCEKSTTEISNLISRNHYATLNFLEELEKESQIERIKAGKFTFWKTKKEVKK